jgi:hypothetical protein
VRGIFVLIFLALAVTYVANAHAEQPRLATFHETASILVDQKLSNNVTASVALQTTSLQEFRIPPALDAKIHNDTNIIAVIITNEDQCVLGVQDKVCVMINVKRMENEGRVEEAQQKAKTAGDALIGDIDKFFGMDTKFHSTFIHYDDTANQVLGTEGQVSGRGTVSAVYVMPYQSSDFLFNTLSGNLIPLQIRDMGGFYNVAQSLARDDSARVTFTILPKGELSFMQLKVAKKFPDSAKQLNQVEPLKYFKVDELKRSDYYKAGFFPLNSILHVVVLPQDQSTTATAGSIIEKTTVGNQTVPASLQNNGWYFESNSGKKIDAMYLFGNTYSANANDLRLGISKPMLPSVPGNIGTTEIVLLGIIGAVAAGAVAYYLKGIKSR